MAPDQELLGVTNGWPDLGVSELLTGDQDFDLSIHLYL